MGSFPSSQLNSDITSKQIKEIKILGTLNLKSDKRSIYYVEFKFADGTKSEMRIKKSTYLKYMQLIQ